MEAIHGAILPRSKCGIYAGLSPGPESFPSRLSNIAAYVVARIVLVPLSGQASGEFQLSRRQAGVAREDRRHRGHRPDRFEGRRHFAPGRSRGRRRLAQERCQQHHRRGPQRGLAGAQVVIDLTNSPSFEDKAVLEFFETSGRGRNLLAEETAAGVRHHVALSIVGTDRMPDNGYFRAEIAQEKLIEASGIPYTIIRSTQFLDFLRGIAAEGTDGNVVRLSPGLFQPIAADHVAAIVVEVALAAPRNSIVEIAGPERAPFNEIVARYLKAVGDPCGRARPRGPILRRPRRGALTSALGEARLGHIGLDEWLRRSQSKA